MDIVSAGPVKAALAVVGMKVERQTQAAMAQVVAQALENGAEVAAQAAPPPGSGRGRAIDASA